MLLFDQDTVWETCSICQGEQDDTPCVWCEGLGLVPHDCEKRDGEEEGV